MEGKLNIIKDLKTLKMLFKKEDPKRNSSAGDQDCNATIEAIEGGLTGLYGAQVLSDARMIARSLAALAGQIAYLNQTLVNQLIEVFVVASSATSLAQIRTLAAQAHVYVDQLKPQCAGFLAQKAEKEPEVEYYDSPRPYGRYMYKKEKRAFERTGFMAGGPRRTRENLVACFGAPKHWRERLNAMSPDQVKTFFWQIRARGGYLVYFTTNVKPVVGPVPQSNGLQEYKFPGGIQVILTADDIKKKEEGADIKLVGSLLD